MPLIIKLDAGKSWVTTVDGELYEKISGNLVPVAWEACSDDSEAEQLRRENDLLRKKLLEVYRMTGDVVSRRSILG